MFTDYDLAVLDSMGIDPAVEDDHRPERPCWAYERVLEAIEDGGLVVPDILAHECLGVPVMIDGREATEVEIRALHELIAQRMAVWGLDEVWLTRRGRAQLRRWARYAPWRSQ